MTANRQKTKTMTTAATIIELRDLLDGDQTVVDKCVDAMRKRGWIKVRLPEELKFQSLACGAYLRTFFEATDHDKMSRGRSLLDRDERLELRLGHPFLGYDCVDANRQALRILTGSELKRQKMPRACTETLTELGMALDETLWKVSEKLCKPLFGIPVAQLAKAGLKMPFFQNNYTAESNAYKTRLSRTRANNEKKEVEHSDNDSSSSSSSSFSWSSSSSSSQRSSSEYASSKKNNSKKSTSESRCALLEATYYHNKGDKDELCAAHYDPGLFSLNVLSTELGLQFRSEGDKWHDVDPSQGILWAGAAAEEIAAAAAEVSDSPIPTVTAGVHRVVLPPDGSKKPRLSVWSEICTQDQIFVDEFLSGGEVKDDKLLIPNIFDKEPYIVPIDKGNLMETLRLVQRLKGIPMSKAIRRPVYNDKREVVGIK